MNQLLHQFQTIGFACDKEYHRGMKDVKRSFQHLKEYQSKALKDFSKVENVVHSIHNIIDKHKRDPLSKSIDYNQKNKSSRLQRCLDRMSQIDHHQQLLDKESGIRGSSIFSDRINSILQQKELQSNQINEELAVDCHLQDENNFSKIMEHLLLQQQYHKQHVNKFIDLTTLKTKRERAKFKIQDDLNRSLEQAKNYYMEKFQLKHMRLTDKLIDSPKKTLIDHKYCLNQTQLSKSEQNRKRIRKVTEKVNKNKILTIQNLYKNSHSHKSEKATEVLKFLESYNKMDIQDVLIEQLSINDSFTMKTETYLRKIFFKFSKQNTEDLNEQYKFLELQGYLEIFKLSHIDIEESELLLIYQNSMKTQCIDLKKGINFSFFKDSLVDIANCISLHPSKEEKLRNLIKENLLEIYDQVLDQNEIRLFSIKCYQDFIIYFNKIGIYLFNQYQDRNKERVNLDQIIQIFIKIQVFPLKFSKRFIRHYYQYCLEEDEGLNLNQFQHFLNLMGLSINKRVYINKELIQIIQYNIFRLQSRFEDITDYEQKIFKKIMVFYFHNDFLNLQKIEQE